MVGMRCGDVLGEIERRNHIVNRLGDRDLFGQSPRLLHRLERLEKRWDRLFEQLGERAALADQDERVPEAPPA